MKEYIYIGIRARRGREIDEKGYNEMIRILNKYPIIVRLWDSRYKIKTKKPILVRMGKGKGKKIGEYRPIKEGEIILEGYIKRELITETIIGLQKEGIFLKDNILELFFYEVDLPK